MTDPDVLDLTHLQRLDLKPGDRLVVTAHKAITFETADRIKAEFARWAPGVPVLVLGDGLTLGVVGEQAAEEPKP